MKPNRPQDTVRTAPAIEEQLKRDAEQTRTTLIMGQRERAKELFAQAGSHDEMQAASQQAGLEIAESELPVNRLSYQPPRSHDEQAHRANMDVVTQELQESELKRLVDAKTRELNDMQRRNEQVDLIASEMKNTHTTRYYSSGE